MNLDEIKEKFGKECIGNVIRIIDTQTIIVNAGSNFLHIDDDIEVYVPGEPILDLDGSFLSNYNYIKERLTVIQVEPRFSICQKKETRTRTISFPLSPLLETNITEHVPLRIDINDIEPLKKIDPLLRIGDPIKLA